jgi:DivIVA domain-containing protein
MRLNHLDILEQCFRDKIFGYNKEDVDTFLHLVAEDFKEITEELDLLKKKTDRENKYAGELNQQETNKNGERQKKPEVITSDITKEKAKRIINAARDHANQHKKKAEHELSTLKREVEKIKQEKKKLIEAIKASAKESLASQERSK